MAKKERKWKGFWVPLVVGLLISVMQFVFITIFLPIILNLSTTIIIALSGILAGICISFSYAKINKKQMTKKLMRNSTFVYFLTQSIIFLIYILIEVSSQKTLNISLTGVLFLVSYSALIYISLWVGGKNYLETKAYKIPKNFFKNIFIYGIFGFAFYKIFSPIDNAFLYNPKLQSTEKIKEKIKNYRKKEKEHYVILVSGSGAITNYIMGFKTTLQESYNALKKRGYTDANIIILSSTIPQGRNPKLGITARATSENLNIVLSYVIKNIKKNGSVVFYYTGHGKRIKKKSTLSIGDAEFNQKELYDYFKLFNGEKVFIFDQCYSGGFMNKLKTLNNIAIMASTKKNKMATNIPEVERIFWRKVGQKENAIKSYKEAINLTGRGHKIAKGVIETVSFRRVRNYYLVYQKGKADIANLKK